MSIMYCEKHHRRWDSDNLDDCQDCEHEPQIEPVQAKMDQCSVCRRGTIWACSDCQMDLRTTVHVCQSQECRDAHEKICPSLLQKRIAELESPSPFFVSDFEVDELALLLCQSENEHPDGEQVRFLNDGQHSLTFKEIAKRRVRVIVNRLAETHRAGQPLEQDDLLEEEEGEDCNVDDSHAR